MSCQGLSRPLLIHCGTIWVHGPALRVPVTDYSRGRPTASTAPARRRSRHCCTARRWPGVCPRWSCTPVTSASRAGRSSRRRLHPDRRPGPATPERGCWLPLPASHRPQFLKAAWSERANGRGVTYRHRVRHAASPVEYMQQEAGRLGDVAGRLGISQAQRALPVRTGGDGHVRCRRTRRKRAVHVPGQHPGDVRVPPDDLGEFGRVGQDHAVEERDADRQRRVMDADEGWHLRPASQSPGRSQASWSGPRYPAGLP